MDNPFVLRMTVSTPLAVLDPAWGELQRKLIAMAMEQKRRDAELAFEGAVEDRLFDRTADELTFAEMFELATRASVANDPTPSAGTHGPTRAFGRR